MKIQEIITALQPLEVIGTVADQEVEYLLTDSRQLGSSLAPNPATTLFFALRTPKNDGARYIPDLYARGVRLFVINRQTTRSSNSAAQTRSSNSETIYLIVEDSLAALQQLAAYKRSLYNIPVIGITGSNGKTVVKEWLYELLKDDYRIVRSPKSYNSQIGVPLSVWQMNADTQLAIFEAGISMPGEMQRLEPIIRPTLGVITYIGEEHGENFANLEAKRAEKMKLFAHCEQVIEDPTHQNVRTCAAVMRALGYDEDVISRRILQQTHETVMRVNLTALVDNVRYFRSLLKPTTKLTCMVKAFAYGAGSLEVSRALQNANNQTFNCQSAINSQSIVNCQSSNRQLVDYLAVAVADEGVELRRAGITLPIIIMDPEVAAMNLILENNLEPNVYSFASLEQVITAAAEKGLEDYPIHIKIDSGMHRLGFYLEELPRLIERLKSTKVVRVRSVFSHLAGSDEAQFDAFTMEQIHYFKQCADTLEQGLLSLSDSGLLSLSERSERSIIRHICNSAGIERFTPYQFDMCRLGIGLYGISFNGAQLRNVCSLLTTILSVKTVKAGETIGYGRHTTLTEDRQIAVIPIGYADGFDRRFSNYGGEVVVRGKRCPVVGNVCMDQAMVDVTGADAHVGDSVEVFGERLPLQELSDRLGTIPYEVLTSVSRRVQRIYYYE
ncbi:MAG: alanine racemase [Paludibacteraceae bacterium]|nr:alanine racemase [Paludibacteraceae bacterium]